MVASIIEYHIHEIVTFFNLWCPCTDGANGLDAIYTRQCNDQITNG